MIREFVAGVVWGGVVAGVGLSVVSEIAPMPGKMVIAEAEVVAAAEAPAGTEASPKVDAAEVPAPEAKVAEAAEPETKLPETKAPETEAPETTTPAAPAPAEPAATEAPAVAPAEPVPAEPPASVADQAVAQPAAPETDAQPSAPAGEPGSPALAAPAASPAPDAAEAPPVAEAAPAAPEAAANPEPPAPVAPPPAPVEPAPKADPPAPAEPAPTAEASLPAAPPPQTDESLLQPLPEAPAQPPVPPAPAEAQPAEPAQMPVLLTDKTVDGVTVGRLPSISTDQPAAAAEAAPPPGTDGTPLGRLKGTFQNPEGKPLFAVLLVDDGSPDLDRAKLAALPFPVTFVLDPLSPNAAEASATYRSAGQQVAMFGAGIPKGATPADVEQTFQTLAAAVPEAVAVVDPGAGGFQDDRKLAAAVVPILKEQGRGLITFDQGLNAADQVARREDLPTATIFRTLDDEGEDTPLIRRYLDRAAFKAAQEGRVIVLGSAKPETVAALLEWAVEGKAATVALAPVSALLEGK